MIHYSANNLSLSFVIDSKNSKFLLKELHEKLIGNEQLKMMINLLKINGIIK